MFRSHTLLLAIEKRRKTLSLGRSSPLYSRRLPAASLALQLANLHQGAFMYKHGRVQFSLILLFHGVVTGFQASATVLVLSLLEFLTCKDILTNIKIVLEIINCLLNGWGGVYQMYGTDSAWLHVRCLVFSPVWSG